MALLLNSRKTRNAQQQHQQRTTSTTTLEEGSTIAWLLLSLDSLMKPLSKPPVIPHADDQDEKLRRNDRKENPYPCLETID